MKKLILSAAMVFGMASMAAAADPIEGTWKTQPDDGAYAYVKVTPCGGGFCGAIARTFNSDGEFKSKTIGKKIIRSMTAKGGGAYEGKVWRPSNDKIYIGKAQVSGNKMKLSGCVAGGLLCSSQTWTKLK